MIPLRDDLGRRGPTPWCWALALLWVAGAAAMWVLPPGERDALQELVGLDPAATRAVWESLLDGRGGGGVTTFLRHGVWGALAFPLLHNGPLHALVDGFLLCAFGGRLEQRCGGRRLLSFLLLATALTALVAALRADGARGPWLGASAPALAAMLVYVLRWPAARLRMMVPVIILPVVCELPVLGVALCGAALQAPPVLRLLSPGPGVPVEVWTSALGALAAVAPGAVVLFAGRRGRMSRSRRKRAA